MSGLYAFARGEGGCACVCDMRGVCGYSHHINKNKIVTLTSLNAIKYLIKIY